MARSDEQALRLRWSGRVPLTTRILAVNILALAMLAGGFFYLDSYRARLLDRRAEQVAEQTMLIAKAGIYDLRLHHDEVVSPVLRAWKIFDRDDFGPAGEKAREELAEFLAGLDAQATRFVESRERARARTAARTTRA